MIYDDTVCYAKSMAVNRRVVNPLSVYFPQRCRDTTSYADPHNQFAWYARQNKNLVGIQVGIEKGTFQNAPNSLKTLVPSTRFELVTYRV